MSSTGPDMMPERKVAMTTAKKKGTTAGTQMDIPQEKAQQIPLLTITGAMTQDIK